MNNTDLITYFSEGINPDATLEELHPGPAELGGPNQQRLTVHFKVNEHYQYEDWAPRSLKQLAQMITYSFGSPIQMYTLRPGPEDNIIEDPFICIREFHTQMEEEWSEPAEDLTPEQVAEFEPRKKWDAHTKVTFEVIFKFNNMARRSAEMPETD